MGIELISFIRENIRKEGGRFNIHVVRNTPDWFKKRGATDKLNDIMESTTFLDDDAKFPERIHCILNGITSKPICVNPKCNNYVNYHQGEYHNYCSNKCHLSSDEKKEKTKQTVIEKYGVTNVSKSLDVRKKLSEANQRNKNKTSKKSIETSYYKWKDHAEERYNELAIEPVFNGPMKREDRIFRCLVCNNEFKQDAFMLSNGLGKHGLRCPHCHPKRESKIELKICNWLDEIGIKFLRNDRKTFGFEVDILIPDKKLCIELDGVLWHSFGHSKYHYINNADREDNNVHLRKKIVAENAGYSLLRFTDIEIQNQKKFEIIKSIILVKLCMAEKIYARCCSTREIDSVELSQFLEENHLIGKLNSSKKFGLFFNDILVQVIGFGKPRFAKDHDWELYRLCTAKNTLVVGGFSKLLKYATNNGVRGKINSFVDRRFSEGCGYESVGFERIRSTPPNYFYWHQKDGSVVKRYEAQKHKLQKLLGNEFDPNKTETDNMYDVGFRKFYDCGNWVYSLELNWD